MGQVRSEIECPSRFTRVGSGSRAAIGLVTRVDIVTVIAVHDWFSI